MTFQIREVDLLDPDIDRQVLQLQRAAFKNQFPEGKIRLNTFLESSSQPTTYVAAFDGKEIIGFVGCLAHDLTYEGRPTVAGQMVWAATNASYRKQGIFTALVERLKEKGRSQGMDFLFAFPTNVSGPIFIKKLAFGPYSPLLRVHIPVTGGIWRGFLRKPGADFSPSTHHTFWQNDEQLIKIKRQEYGNEVIRVEENGNMIWGKVRPRSFGPVSLNYFDVGGIQLTNPGRFPSLISKLLDQVSVQYLQLVLHHSHPYLPLFRFPRPAPGSEPLSVCDLSGRTGSETRYAFMTGIKDVF